MIYKKAFHKVFEKTREKGMKIWQYDIDKSKLT